MRRACGSRTRQKTRWTRSEVYERARVLRIPIWDDKRNRLRVMDDLCAQLQSYMKRKTKEPKSYQPVTFTFNGPVNVFLSKRPESLPETGKTLNIGSLTVSTPSFKNITDSKTSSDEIGWALSQLSDLQAQYIDAMRRQDKLQQMLFRLHQAALNSHETLNSQGISMNMSDFKKRLNNLRK